MKKSKPPKPPTSELRKHAEKILQGQPDDDHGSSKLSPDEMDRLYQELQIHQIELEAQNEELRKTQQELETSQKKYSDLYDFAPVGIFTLDKNTIIIEANLTGTSMLGIERSAMIGESFSKHITRDTQDIFYRHRQLLIETETQQSCELELKKKDNTQLYARLESTPVIDDDKNFMQFRTAVMDITKRKELEDQLRQSHKIESIGTMAAGMAHDFNNILYMITGNTELAIEDIPKGNPAHDSLNEIKAASFRAAGIVKQLLNFSRKTDQPFKPIRIVKVITDTFNFLRSIIPTSIEIRKHLQDEEIITLGDPTQINQLIMNICINASQAMTATGGILDIVLEKITIDKKTAAIYSKMTPGDYLKIMVSDTGPGIDPKIIDRIFDPYFTTKEVGLGSGMGLSIVHGIVRSHNGDITVMSQPGKGTTFTILFPTVTEKPEIETAATDELPLGSERILFVDDEQPIVKVVERILKRLGYQVDARGNPNEALDLFQSKPEQFDLVITDMTMPQMTGVKLSEKLKEIRSDIPIIICTGHSTLIDEEKAKEIGIAAYVMKPITKQEIANSIRKVLDNS